MNITDFYNPFIKSFRKNGSQDIGKIVGEDSRLNFLWDLAQEWGSESVNVQRWMASPEYHHHESIAKKFIIEAPKVLKKVEHSFKTTLVGDLSLCPSMMQFDGYARYDSGHHNVWFGVDHPDADLDYLHALLAHELSHVYRDHQPGVWGYLGKPLEKISRRVYLDNTTAQEHLVSEGLATLNSQLVYPEIPLAVHHYYIEPEMQWCLDHFPLIDKALRQCLTGDENVWKFYDDDIIAPGSPSRTQYFWAAKILADWLPPKTGLDLKSAIILAHGWPAKDFDCFSLT